MSEQQESTPTPSEATVQSPPAEPPAVDPTPGWVTFEEIRSKQPWRPHNDNGQEAPPPRGDAGGE